MTLIAEHGDSTDAGQPIAEADVPSYIKSLGKAARNAASSMSVASSAQKDHALHAIADAIEANQSAIIDANRIDLEAARNKGIDAALLDRLELTAARVASMAQGLRSVAAQSDPVGALSETNRMPSGLEIARMRVPLGVIGVIYESRPNVTADAAGLCIKSGNVVILRGGSEAALSNRAIGHCIQQGLEKAQLPENAVQLVETIDRAAVGALLELDEYIDVIIPRGGKGLVQRISEQARVPVIKHLDGICHVFIDEGANRSRAMEVALNAKTYRYGICGSMETLLLHEGEAQIMLPELADAFGKAGVELRGCPYCLQIIPDMKPATDADWDTEYLGPILSVRVVADIDAAMAHIARHGSSHTDAIVTENMARARRFVRQVDSSSVMVNAATCFADGAEYGLGAEIGISTNRMHVRGPVGVLGLTCEKYVVTGDYTVRG